MNKKTLLSLALGAAFPGWPRPRCAQAAAAADDAPERIKSLGVVTVTGGRPTSLPTQIPTTIEGVTREEIETRINATDSEDALKYLPSLLVRKRYIGDYNHAILSTPRLGHRQQRALGGVCRRHPAVELPRQRHRQRHQLSRRAGAW